MQKLPSTALASRPAYDPISVVLELCLRELARRSVPRTPGAAILAEVWDERDRGIAKHGVKNIRSIPYGPTGEAVCERLEIPSEWTAKARVNEFHRLGVLTWADIALEEFAEAISARNEFDRREELVQLAAVIMQWIECIDRHTVHVFVVE